MTGCPYESDTALLKAEEGEKLDRSLRGEWTAFYKDGSADEIIISKADKRIFYINHKSIDENGRPRKSYGKFRIYATEIGDELIVNAEKKKGGHFFAKYEFEDKMSFNLYYVKEEFVKANFKKYDDPSPEALREFLSENLKNEDMWEMAAQFINHESEFYKMHDLNRGF